MSDDKIQESNQVATPTESESQPAPPVDESSPSTTDETPVELPAEVAQIPTATPIAAPPLDDSNGEELPAQTPVESSISPTPEVSSEPLQTPVAGNSPEATTS